MSALFGFSGTASGFRRANEWIAQAEDIARENSDGYGLAFGALARGMTLCCSGSWLEAITRFDAAATTFGEHFAKGDWEATVARTTALFALMQLGNFSELGARARSCMQDALRRGDLALEVEAGLNLALCAAASDRLDEAAKSWIGR